MIKRKMMLLLLAGLVACLSVACGTEKQAKNLDSPSDSSASASRSLGTPDVTGVLETVASGEEQMRLTHASDAYYEQMSMSFDGEPNFLSNAGQQIEPANVAPGSRVEVWIADGCDQSQPVQCSVAAIRLLDV